MIKKLINKIKNNKLTFISIIAILFIPVLYAGNFIAAFADPYNNLSQVKVAIVNNDKSIETKGKEVNLGNEFIKSLKETKNFKWQFVTEEKAKRGMKNNTYYFKVEIPEDFTKNIYSTLNGTAKTANLIYSANDNNNYIGGVLGGVLVKELNLQLNEKVISSFITELGTSLNNVDKLSIGVTALLNGSEQLKNGAFTLNDGIKKLDENTSKLYKASTELTTGIDTLNNGYTTFNSGINKVSSSLDQVNNGYASLNTSLKTYFTQIDAIINSSISEPNKTTLINSYKEIEAKLGYLNTNLNTINSSVSTLNTSSSTISTNLNKINSGSKTLTNYLAELVNGTNKLSEGSNTLYNGASTLNTGLNDLNSGVNEFKTKINNLNLVKNANNIASPVKQANEPYSEVKNYGYGFSPYFVSLGLFVGALVSTIIINAKTEKTKKDKYSLKRVLKKIVLYASIVITQALILDAIVLSTSIKIDNNLEFILFSILISITFMSLIQMLSTIFGNPGRFIAIIILILQLTACGGTFPVETAPSFYNSIHSFMPMTYTVEGLRVIVGNGNMSILMNNIILLVTISVVCYSLILIYFRKSKKFI